MIAGMGSGSGKTTVTLGVLNYLKRIGHSVQPFKCGPDYIDPGFHREACGITSRNLDSWMMGGEKSVRESFDHLMVYADCAVVEGVMGLFDGTGSANLEGSSAHIAKILGIPVFLVVNARGVASTIAPMVKGFVNYREGVEVAGVIANNVGSSRHAEILKNALREADLPPLVGYLPRNERWNLPERHLGLVPEKENTKRWDWYDALGDQIAQYFDIDLIKKLTNQTRTIPRKVPTFCPDIPDGVKPKLGVALDEAFHFYYQDNLDLLKANGVDLIYFSPLNDKQLPDDLDGLYLGGGFPEMFSAKLTENKSMRNSIANFADSGRFVYGECGGFMYLCRSIRDFDGDSFPMCGVIPVETSMESSLRRLGYIEGRFAQDSPFGAAGILVRGHEFHWSKVLSDSKRTEPDGRSGFFCETRGAKGGEWKSTGFQMKNTWASYVHSHFMSNPSIPENLADYLRNQRSGKSSARV